ncbi:hypothetical protein CSC94_18750 [Zhengella mangrovi]|uniref:DUF1640 domain-containing protein n=1 Tax=Zhengella mangrovi TaxID=1982044 RepID=A0A2G1QIX0_9HYPH|nr:hypothetical protein [Zhengella mangrovi]PHP65401.1 hypothetical protein CSC94_18750 [Zhengella mangrovi]
MQTTSIDILNMLVDAGIDRDKAEPLAREILTRTEARETLATKSDLWRVALTQTGMTVGAIGVLLALFQAI